METIHRIPRPQGITNMCISLHNEKDTHAQKQKKNKIREILIQRYLTEGNTITGIPLTLEQLQLYLGDNKKGFLRRVKRVLTHLNPHEGGKDRREELFGGIFSALIQGGLADRGLIAKQVHLLTAAQGGTYKPFISAEVNRGLKLMLDSTKTLTDLAKLLVPSGSINMTQNNNNGDELTLNQNYITTKDAVQMLDEKAGNLSILEAPEKLTYLKEAYIDDDVPHVGAIGTSDSKGQYIEVHSPSKHETRRAKEMNLE